MTQSHTVTAADIGAVAPQQPEAPTTPSPPSRTERGLALAAVCLGFFMILLDGSALNIALPAVQRDIHGSIAALQWVVNIYTIPLAGLLLAAGNIGDRWGSRRLFYGSLIGFTVASLACALSPSLEFLVTFRALQGIMAAGMLPTTLAIIARTYTNPVERAKAITFWGATGGVALVSGPLLGGVLTEFLGWRSIFMINVPVGIIALVLTLRYIRENERRAGKSLDLPGQFFGILALAGLVGVVIEGGSLGWASPIVLGLLGTTLVAAAVFVVIEMRSSHPMLPLAMFRRAAFTASVTNGFAFQLGAYGMQFMLALYLQDQWHLTAGQTGLIFVPFGVCWVVGTIVLNRKLVGHGPRLLLWTGAAAALLGALLMLGVTGPATWPLFVIGTSLVGLGCGLFSPSLNAAAMLSVDPAFTGLGSGVLNTARQVGMAMGIAVLGVLVALSNAVAGMHAGMAVVAACFLAIVVLSVRYVPKKEA